MEDLGKIAKSAAKSTNVRLKSATTTMGIHLRAFASGCAACIQEDPRIEVFELQTEQKGLFKGPYLLEHHP